MRPETPSNLGRLPESLEAKLRALPQPPVPADLEARLLATIPAEIPIPQRRWAVWAGVVGPLAAACLLAVFTGLQHDGKNPVPGPGTRKSTHPVTVTRPGTSASAAAPGPRLPTRPTLRQPDDDSGIAAWWAARRVLDGAELPAFTWPLQETSPIVVPTSIPADLLD